MARNNWTREETLLAFYLYCKIPFGKIHASNQQIIELAKCLGRTPSSVSMKMGNLARYDSVQLQRGVKGLAHGSKMEEIIWNEFRNDSDNLVLEAEMLLSNMKENNIIKEVNMGYIIAHIGDDREQLVKQRVGQNFFRSAILSSYDNRCCITGIAIDKLLIASHIKPWHSSDSKTERTNPGNGLCLNALHDRAFDQGLITVNQDYKIIISPNIKKKEIDEVTKAWIVGFEGRKIILPNRFLPEKQFIEYHNDVIFQHG